MKILIADDDPVSCRLLEKLLSKWGYQTITAHSGTEAWEVLQAEHAPRLVLLDWMMPGIDGLEICRRVRARSSQPYVYIMLLTANDRVGNLVEGLESGADDYLTKPFHPQELRARLRVGLRMLELESSLVEAREHLQFKASHDALTSIWNRGAIIELLERELSRARREGSSVGILLADVDHFKNINDTWGHLVGDEVLRAITGRLKAEVRSYDAVGRYGGVPAAPRATRNARRRSTAKAPRARPNCRRRAPREKHGRAPRPTARSCGRMARRQKPRSLVRERLRRRARKSVRRSARKRRRARDARGGAAAGFAVLTPSGCRLPLRGEARLLQGGGRRQGARSFCAREKRAAPWRPSVYGPRRNDSGWRKSNCSKSRTASARSCGNVPTITGMNAEFYRMDWRPAWATSWTAARGWKKSAG